MSKHNSSLKSSHELPNVREPSVMLSDLTSDLLWPRVLRAPAMALSPSRLISGSVCAFLLALVLQLVSILKPDDETVTGGVYNEFLAVGYRLNTIAQNLIESALALDPLDFAQSIGSTAWTIRDTVMESPLISLIIGLPLIAILSVAGGSISRSAALEFATGRFASRDDTLGFTLRRIRQFVGAVIGPIVLCVIIFLLIAVGGLLLSVPALDVVGSILYAVALCMGIFATVVLMLHVLALPMIIPALAIEGTDSFDAIQRSYAYVIGKPLRYLSYTLILLFLGVLSAAVFTLVAHGSIEMTDWAASFFASDSTQRVLTNEGEMGATKATANSIIEIWRTIIKLFVAGYVISLFFTSSTMLYLVIRRICDGQDVNEVWDGVGE
jgi:hypothetical protein